MEHKSFYGVHKNPPLDSTMSHLNTFQTPKLYFYQTLNYDQFSQVVSFHQVYRLKCFMHFS
jgi:hypothetical protein